MSYRSFLLLLEKGRRDYDRQNREIYNFLDAFFEKTVSIPIPELPRRVFCLEVEVEAPFESIALLPSNTRGKLQVKRVCITTEGREIALTLEGGEGFTVEKVRVVVAPQMPLARFIPLLLILRILSEKGVDPLAIVEEELGKPGLLSETRQIFQLASKVMFRE
ncbi:MAG: hypothetical protein QXJ59_06455 [Thermofilaceae archaeon]